MQEKINLKDRKIMYQLDLNCRQSLGSIGSKVGLPKNVVAYRIKRLEQGGIIKNYYTIVDASRLGYQSLRFYFDFQYTDRAVEQEIIEHFKSSKLTWWVGSMEPLHDLGVVLWLKDFSRFYEFWKQTLEKYGHYFKAYYNHVYIKLIHYPFSYLIGKNHHEQKAQETGSHEPVGHDQTDIRILRLLAANARASLTEISKNLGISVTVVNYRIKKLLQKGIIQGFRTNFDLNKLGIINTKLNIYLKDFSVAKKIITLMEKDPRLIYTDFTIGYADVEFEFHLKSIDEIHDIIESIKLRFPGVVRDSNYFIYKKLHKVQLMPEE